MAKYKKFASIVCMTAGVLMGAAVSNGSQNEPEKETMKIAETTENNEAVKKNKETADSEFFIRTPRQAYELCFADYLDNSGAKEGIESGWEIDNRAGKPKTDFSNNGVISDVMENEHSRLIRYFNTVTEGKIDLQFQVKYLYNFNGNVLDLCDEEGTPVYYLVTKENTIWIQNPDGSLTKLLDDYFQDPYDVVFRVIVDLDRRTSTTYINNIECGTYPLTGDRVRYLAFETLDETLNETQVMGGYVEANYEVYESFDNPVSQVSVTLDNAEKLSAEDQHLILPEGVETGRSFDALGSKVNFSFYTYLPEGSDGVYTLLAGDMPVVQLTAKDGSFYNGTQMLKEYTDQMWYHIRVEADMESQSAVIKINQKEIAQIDFLTQTDFVNRIHFENTGNTKIFLDDIRVNQLVDYEMEAVTIPEGADDYIIGINVCSLWRNGEHTGWATITPYEDIRPVLGYYDEGQPQTSDWEIKFLAEHGIDFQAFCWLGRESDKPIKQAWDITALDNGFLHAKNKDKMKFCLIWEAANGATPVDSDAFRNYFVPYWMEYYFSNPSYMTIENKVVFAVFGADSLISKFGTGLKAEFDYLREEVKKLGFDGAIILDCNSYRTEGSAAYGFDGWYAYNWGQQGCYYEANVNLNRKAKEDNDVYTIPTVSSGFNAIGWHGVRTPVMTAVDFKKTNEWVRDTYLKEMDAPDWATNFVMLSSWNEYGEGTYLMPCEKNQGFGYLDAVREIYTKGEKHEDIVPDDTQLAQIGHAYPQDKRVLRDDGTYETSGSENVRIFDFLNDANAYETYLKPANFKGKITTSKDGIQMETGENPDGTLTFLPAMYEGLTADDVINIRVRAKVPKGEYIQLYYAVNGGSLTEGNSIKFYSETDEETDYVFPMSEYTNWYGNITKLRLDPIDGNDLICTIKSITLELAQDLPGLRVNGFKLENKIQMETVDGVDYFPFEPAESLISYYLYTYYEWDQENQALMLYRNQKSYRFEAGKDIALVNGEEKSLGGTVYMKCGIPMLPVEGLAKVLGFPCVKDGQDYVIDTPEKTLFSAASKSASDGNNFLWIFDTVGNFSQKSGFQMWGWSAKNANVGYGIDYLELLPSRLSDGGYQPSLTLKKPTMDCEKQNVLKLRLKWKDVYETQQLAVVFATEDKTNNTTSDQTDNETDNIQIGQGRIECKLSEYKAEAAASEDGFVTISIDLSGVDGYTGTVTEFGLELPQTRETVDIASIWFESNSLK